MSTEAVAARRARFRPSHMVLAATAVALLAAIALDTTYVSVDSAEGARAQGFSPETYGAEEFPNVQSAIEGKATDAAALAAAIAANKDEAVAQHGTPSGIAPVMSVTFTGVAGEPRSGIYPVTVEGAPDDLVIRVQTGPAINGTELRDAPGTIEFGQFTNQIEYQNAGAALNEEMKKQVLAGVDTANLNGKTITVTGAFRLINPKSWLVTPVRMSVE
ncbi:DUF2291 domain-containing protein [Aureimonas sp. OT7]|uniref:Periplasmic lipoprotein n=1 Tax=Aureimonas altamirensis TaxID=370622 RepID=A0A0B1Q4X6_9HYPH|nr:MULTISPECIES: DUF2291 domain-containing protein [Aureimonas]KHJ54431.1 hypothetical protein LA66_13355 [Aureimonas altamirensis]QOG05452.1 DUF2291 domain-containing protein [Aureimonas sp. OT7]